MCNVYICLEPKYMTTEIDTETGTEADTDTEYAMKSGIENLDKLHSSDNYWN